MTCGSANSHKIGSSELVGFELTRRQYMAPEDHVIGLFVDLMQARRYGLYRRYHRRRRCRFARVACRGRTLARAIG